MTEKLDKAQIKKDGFVDSSRFGNFPNLIYYYDDVKKLNKLNIPKCGKEFVIDKNIIALKDD
ncbi:7914_t:CDS:2, partial [Entrophospora sp. SA101]